MIVDLIAKVLVGFLTGVLGLFPAYSLPDSVTQTGASLGAALGSVNGVVPIATLGLCLAAYIGARLFLLAVSAVVFVYRLVPLKFT